MFQYYGGAVGGLIWEAKGSHLLLRIQTVRMCGSIEAPGLQVND